MVLAWVAHDDALNGIGQLLGYQAFSDQPVEGSSGENLLRRRATAFGRDPDCAIIFGRASIRGIAASPYNLYVLWSGRPVRLPISDLQSSSLDRRSTLVWYWLGTFLIGLLSESRGVGAIPILGYVLGLLLWHSTPGENINTLSYDIGWLGFLLLPVGIPGLMLYLLFRFGRALR